MNQHWEKNTFIFTSSAAGNANLSDYHPMMTWPDLTDQQTKVNERVDSDTFETRDQSDDLQWMTPWLVNWSPVTIYTIPMIPWTTYVKCSFLVRRIKHLLLPSSLFTLPPTWAFEYTYTTENLFCVQLIICWRPYDREKEERNIKDDRFNLIIISLIQSCTKVLKWFCNIGRGGADIWPTLAHVRFCARPNHLSAFEVCVYKQTICLMPPSEHSTVVATKQG